jgi:hypothetical protein
VRVEAWLAIIAAFSSVPLDIGRDVDRAYTGNRGHAVRLQPGAELAHRLHEDCEQEQGK